MRRRGDILWREVDGPVVAMDPQSSRYFSVNATGARLWRLLEKDTDRNSLIDALIAQGAGLEEAELDVDAFVTELRSNDLIED